MSLGNGSLRTHIHNALNRKPFGNVRLKFNPFLSFLCLLAKCYFEKVISVPVNKVH